MNDDTTDGFELLCDREGRIIEVLRDGGVDRLSRGALFTTALDPASLPKAGEFLAEIERSGDARGWELNVRSGEQVSTMYFAGRHAPGGVMVVARRHAEPAEREQTAASPRELDLYDELSRLNNELVTMQRELARKNAELQRMDKLKNQFLGIVAHDLRSPLSIIVAYSDFLMHEDHPPLSERQQRFVGSIRSSSQFMVDLVNDLLDVSAIEAGSLELAPVSTDLAALVRESVEMHSVLGSKKQITIALDLAEGVPELVIDPRRIEQVLNNLLDNALKYSPIGGSIEVALARENDDVVLSIADHGQGIPESDLAMIFEPYRRSRTRGTAGEKSTGLGLTIARRIVEAHRGSISVESAEGAGTTFRVALPVRLPR